MIKNKKVIVWDLDNTLYIETAEFKDLLDETMAVALVEDLGVDMDVQTAKQLVKDSYKRTRNGGEIFFNEYGIDEKALFDAYHERKPVEAIVPYDNLLERLKQIPLEQYILTASSHNAAERILKHIGLYEFFKGRFYSIEDFGIYTKNENAKVYKMFCDKIGKKPEDCIFVDDSYSNLEFAKEIGMTTVRIFYKDNSAKDKEYIDAAYKGVNGFLDEVIPLINADA